MAKEAPFGCENFTPARLARFRGNANDNLAICQDATFQAYALLVNAFVALNATWPVEPEVIDKPSLP